MKYEYARDKLSRLGVSHPRTFPFCLAAINFASQARLLPNIAQHCPHLISQSFFFWVFQVFQVFHFGWFSLGGFYQGL